MNNSARPRFPFNRTRWFQAASLGVLLSSVVAGCSPLYVMRAAYEEGKILWRREPIAQVLSRPQLEAEAREKLELVLEVREYARAVLKMNVGGSYASYSYVDRPDLSYILTAAPKTELKPYTWWFLIVGRVPYKGFFSKEDAQAAAEKLQADGYDTHIRAAAAFSTLGWFDDPLLAHLLQYDKITLADVVFHELFHNTLYVKGAGSFNESMANFVGGRAAIDFFREKHGPGSREHQQAAARWSEELEFAEFVENVAASLSALYAKNLPYEDKLRNREAIFAQAKADWAESTSARPGHRFHGFSKLSLNNAVMINFLLYMNNLKLFESLYQVQGQKSLNAVIEAVRRALNGGGEPFANVQALLAESSISTGQDRVAPPDGVHVLRW